MNSAADYATIISTGFTVYALLARTLTRARRRRVSEFLSQFDVQLIALLGGALAAAVSTIILLQIENGDLLRQHSQDLSAFDHAASVVEHAAGTIYAKLEAIFKQVGGK